MQDNGIPAEELRAAAKMLRETAAKATRGPWCCYPTPTRDHDLDEDSAYTVSKGYCLKENGGGECEPDCGADVVRTGGMGCQEDTLKADDAVWIALANPDLAEPLADWLESCATQAAKVSDPRNQAIIADQHALKVARVINGGHR